MKNKNFLLAVGISALAFLFLFVYLRSKEKSIVSKGTLNRVIVSKTYIQSGATLTADLLKETEVPEQYIQPGAIRKIEDAVDKVAIAPIGEGEQILANKITRIMDYLSLAVPIGKRAFTISVDSASGLNELIKPGDCVDVLGTFEESSSRGPFTATILQNVKIVAVNTRFNIMQKNKEDSISNESLGASTVTLALEPSEGEILTFAENKGRLKLTLRNPADTEIVLLKSTNFSNFLRNVQKETTKQVNDTQSLEVIRGTEGEKIQIKK